MCLVLKKSSLGTIIHMPRNKVAPYETGSGAVLRLAPVDFDFDVEKLKVSGFVVEYFLGSK